MHTDKRKCFLQANFNTLGIKVSYKVILSLLMGMIKHSLKTQSNKFAISLQYLKKEARNGAQFFCMQINIKVSTSWDYRFCQKCSDISKLPNILRKKCHICFCVLLRCKVFTYFMGVQSCSLLTVI